jgi:Ala-tRNA(Pro) deacylase
VAEKEFLQIQDFLKSRNVNFEHIVHEHVHRSEDAAKIRGNKIEQAAKAIILKIRHKKSKEYEFIQCVISGHRKIDLKKLKVLLNLDNASLASPEEVLEKTNCTVGSVPPFGIIFGLRMFIENSVTEQEFIFFSAGTHNDSIKMRSADYLNVLNVETSDFCLKTV